MYNTIILLKGKKNLSRKEYRSFSKGDTIWGLNGDPEEIARWVIDDEEEARKELAKFNCSYDNKDVYYSITEYALQYCECDSNGEFMTGSDFDLANEA